MSDRIIRTKELMHKSGLTRASMYRKRQSDPNFPKPIKLGDRGVGFSEKEADAY
ncbi:MAG: AlpA family phage regulatory protein, partial [Bacteroidetes bacterium]|nr:AlpA family phage regulatory protein [Bacteroidota bacterium]